MPKRHNAPKIKKRADDGSMNKKGAQRLPCSGVQKNLHPFLSPKLRKIRQTYNKFVGFLRRFRRVITFVCVYSPK